MLNGSAVSNSHNKGVNFLISHNAKLEAMRDDGNAPYARDRDVLYQIHSLYRND